MTANAARTVPVTVALARFAAETTFADVAGVSAAVRGYLLDALGCGIAGTVTDKGRIAIRQARRLGAGDESAVIGGGRASAAAAAFANAELINALDFDAVPHVQPIAVPAVLAFAEAVGASGADVVLATTLAHEIGVRTSRATSDMISSLIRDGQTPDVFGICNDSIVGAAAACARLVTDDPDVIASAMGLAAAMCPVPTARDWELTEPKSMVKYLPAGWVAHGAVTAAQLALDGFTASTAAFDTDHGFGRYYGHGVWRPEQLLPRRSDPWAITAVQYKRYPACRFHHSQLDVAAALLRETPTAPEDIESIVTAGMPFTAKADPYQVENPFDAQFSLPYAMALIVHGIQPGLRWQAPETMADPRIGLFMRRVIPEVLPDARQRKQADPRAWPCRVEMRTRRGILRGVANHASGDPVDGFRLTDRELHAKFLANVRDAGFDQEAAAALTETLAALPDLPAIRGLPVG